MPYLTAEERIAQRLNSEEVRDSLATIIEHAKAHSQERVQSPYLPFALTAKTILLNTHQGFTNHLLKMLEKNYFKDELSDNSYEQKNKAELFSMAINTIENFMIHANQDKMVNLRALNKCLTSLKKDQVKLLDLWQAEQHSFKAIDYFKKEKYPEAIEHFTRAIEGYKVHLSNESNVLDATYDQMAQSYHKLKDYQQENTCLTALKTIRNRKYRLTHYKMQDVEKRLELCQKKISINKLDYPALEIWNLYIDHIIQTLDKFDANNIDSTKIFKQIVQCWSALQKEIRFADNSLKLASNNLEGSKFIEMDPSKKDRDIEGVRDMQALTNERERYLNNLKEFNRKIISLYEKIKALTGQNINLNEQNLFRGDLICSRDKLNLHQLKQLIDPIDKRQSLRKFQDSLNLKLKDWQEQKAEFQKRIEVKERRLKIHERVLLTDSNSMPILIRQNLQESIPLFLEAIKQYTYKVNEANRAIASLEQLQKDCEHELKTLELNTQFKSLSL